MMGLIRIEVARDGHAAVYGPIWCAPVVRSLPKATREWDVNTRCWRVDRWYLDRVVTLLEAAEYRVRVIRPGKPIPPVQVGNRQLRGAQ